MTDPINNSDTFRESLHESECPWYDMFVDSEGRKPSCMMELMDWSAGRQQATKSFWEGIFGV